MLAATVSVRPGSPYLLSDAMRLGVAACFGVVAVWAARKNATEPLGAGALRALLRRDGLVVGLLAAFVFGATFALDHAVLGAFPHISDEASYWFQARVFASGRLTVPAPPLVEFYPSEWVVAHGGKWFSVFPPGWPLLLSIGMRLGAPSLVNPALAALSLVAMHRLALSLVGREKALIAVLLGAVSPFFLFMGASFMSHMASLLFAASFLFFFVKGSKDGRLALFALSGACAGVGFLVRPLDAAVLWAAAAGTMSRAALLRTDRLAASARRRADGRGGRCVPALLV